MQLIERIAEVSIARGFGFAALGIVTFMLGFVNDLALCTEMGGLAFLIVCLVLYARGRWAPHRPYKRTEVWIMLSPVERPHAEVAQKIIGGVLQETYLRFALHAASISVGLLLVSVVFRLRG